MIDIHSHILPGIDDGPSEVEASIEMARLALEDGIRTVVCTPHLDPREPFSPDYVAARVARLTAALYTGGVELELLPGAEIPLMPDLPQQASEEALPLLGGRGKHLLIELPFFGVPTFAEQTLFELQLAGYVPVIAHPERSELARRRPELMETLAERGILLQVNVASLLGHEGRTVRNLALNFIREGIATLIATDAHDPYHRPPLLSPCRRIIDRVRKPELFEALTLTNPAEVLGMPV